MKMKNITLIAMLFGLVVLEAQGSQLQVRVQEDIALLNKEIPELEQSVSKPLLTKDEFNASERRVNYFLSFLNKPRTPIELAIKQGFIDRLQHLKDKLTDRSKRHEDWLLRWKMEVDNDIRDYQANPKMNPARLEQALTIPTKKQMMFKIQVKYQPIIKEIHQKIRQVLGIPEPIVEDIPQTSITGEEQKLLDEFTKEYLEFDLSGLDEDKLDDWYFQAQKQLKNLKDSMTTTEGKRKAIGLGLKIRNKLDTSDSAL